MYFFHLTQGVELMKLYAMLVSLVISSLLMAGCHNTATGLTQDVEQNAKDVRKAINEN
jgi:predicted small secreted protein